MDDSNSPPFSRVAGFSIGQVNLQHAIAASADLCNSAHHLGLDAVLIQEPWIAYGGPKGLRPARVLSIGTAPLAAIAIFARGIDVLFLEHLSTSHCVCAELVRDGESLYVISLYCQYGDDVERYLQQLDKVLTALPNKKIVIGSDSNARSPLWDPRAALLYRSAAQRARDEAVEEFIFQHGLQLWNNPVQGDTLRGSNGSSAIDITISRGISSLTDWRIHPDEITSDHCLITFNIPRDSHSDSTIEERCGGEYLPRSFRNINSETWDRLLIDIGSGLDRLANNYPDGNIETSLLASSINNVIVRAAESALGRSNSVANARVPWWSENLSRLKSAVKRALRLLRVARADRLDGHTMELRQENYRNAVRKYKREIRKSKRSSWKKFVESMSADGPWGPAYRAVSNANAAPLSAICSAQTGNLTISAFESGEALVDSLLPADTAEKDQPAHTLIRAIAASYGRHQPCADYEDLPTEEELDRIFKNLGLRKAPGVDRINGPIARAAWRAGTHELLQLYRRCFINGIFPECWKVGYLKILRKAKSDRHASDPKGYRLISLLPTLGKVLEKLIAARLNKVLEATCPLSTNQFGFRARRSTEDAILAVISAASQPDNRFALVTFLDISGAFDNAWWPMILVKLSLRGVHGNLISMLHNYFRYRFAIYEFGGRISLRELSIGCPQGSVLGPILWNVLVDDILSTVVPSGCSLYAYADDITLVTVGASRNELENKANRALTSLAEWATLNRLSFSAGKSENLWIGKTWQNASKRSPTLKLSGRPISTRESTVYLGIQVDCALSFIPHARYITQRALSAFACIYRLCAGNWGLDYRARRVAYSSIYVSIVAYAARVWAHRVTSLTVSRILLRGQRGPVLLMTSAMRTASTDCLPVLAGILPVDLAILRRAARTCVSKRIPFDISAAYTTPVLSDEDFGNPDKRNQTWKAIDSEVHRLWQRRWDAGTKGRQTHSFLPCVNTRMKRQWLAPDRWTSQFITGHGRFRAKLRWLGLRDSNGELITDDMCICGLGPQDADHVIWSCPEMSDERTELFSVVRGSRIGPLSNRDLVMNKRNYKAFTKFAHAFGNKTLPNAPFYI